MPLIKEDGFEISWTSCTHEIANCGIGSITSMYVKKYIVRDNKEWGATTEYLLFEDSDKEKVWAIWDKYYNAMIGAVTNNTILLSDRVDLGLRPKDEIFGQYMKTYHFVEWLIAREKGAVVQSPCATNALHYGHITQLWMFYPHAKTMVDMDLQHFVPREFKESADKRIKSFDLDRAHIEKYLEWKAHLEETMKNSKSVEVPQKSIPDPYSKVSMYKPPVYQALDIAQAAPAAIYPVGQAMPEWARFDNIGNNGRF